MTFDPSRRPRAHFTPRRDWMNDPNGLLYHDGEYHLFFQHSVGSILPGNPSWGHAVSRDLVTWRELPVAIASTPAEWVLSGSAVMDFADVSGLGTPQRPAMVAAYTGLDTATLQQRQSLAYSLDLDGRSPGTRAIRCSTSVRPSSAIRSCCAGAMRSRWPS